MTACLGEAGHITRLEHAQARLTLSYNRRGDLAIHLVSPMGTRSTLLAARCLPCPLPCTALPPLRPTRIHSFTRSLIHSPGPDGRRMLPLLACWQGWFCPMGLSILQESPIPHTTCHVCVPALAHFQKLLVKTI